MDYIENVLFILIITGITLTHNTMQGGDSMKRFITLLIAMAMLTTSLTALAVEVPTKDYPQRFWDVSKDHWAFRYIADLEERGVIDG